MDTKTPPVSTSAEVKNVQEKYADVTLRLLEDHGDDFGRLTPDNEKKLRRKLYFHIIFLLSVINIMLFVSSLRHISNTYTNRYRLINPHLDMLQFLGFLKRRVYQRPSTIISTHFSMLVSFSPWKITKIIPLIGFFRIPRGSGAWALPPTATPIWQICERNHIFLGNCHLASLRCH